MNDRTMLKVMSSLTLVAAALILFGAVVVGWREARKTAERESRPLQTKTVKETVRSTESATGWKVVAEDGSVCGMKNEEDSATYRAVAYVRAGEKLECRWLDPPSLPSPRSQPKDDVGLALNCPPEMQICLGIDMSSGKAEPFGCKCAVDLKENEER